MAERKDLKARWVAEAASAEEKLAIDDYERRQQAYCDSIKAWAVQFEADNGGRKPDLDACKRCVGEVMGRDRHPQPAVDACAKRYLWILARLVEEHKAE